MSKAKRKQMISWIESFEWKQTPKHLRKMNNRALASYHRWFVWYVGNGCGIKG